MEQATCCWMETVQPNLGKLTECTIVTPELLNSLHGNNLITSSEKGNLMNQKSAVEQATVLYEIARKWDHKDFQNFKAVLKQYGNTLALQILNEAEQSYLVYVVSKKGENGNLEIKQIERVLNDKLQLGTDGRLLELRPSIGQDPGKRANEANGASFPASKTHQPRSSSDRSDLEDAQAGIRGKLEQVETKQKETSVHLTRIGSDVEVLKLKSGEADAKHEEFGQDINQLKQFNEVSIGRLSVVEQKVETTMSVKSKEWEQGGLIPFKVHKAIGLWYVIEGFTRHERFTPTTKCEEEVFALTGSTIHSIRRYQPINSRTIEEIKSTYSVNNSSPHYWTPLDKKNNTYRRWMKTDYDNWGVFLNCEYQDISSTDVLYILSKQRTPNATTLNVLKDLRNFAEDRGFPKSSGCPVEQSP